MLEKIEKIGKIAEYSFSNEDDTASLTSMQSFLYNLKNLQNILNQSSSHIHLPARKSKILPSTIHKHQHKSDLSIGNIQTSSMFSEVSPNSSLRSSSRTSQSQTKIPKTAPEKASYPKLMKNMLISQKLMQKQNLEGEKERQSPKISLNFNRMKSKKFRSKVIPILSKNQRFFEDKQVNLDEKVVQKLGLYETANIYKASNMSKFLNQKYQDKLKPVINLKFSTFQTCNRNQFFLTENTQLQVNESPYLDTIRQNSQHNEESSINNENEGGEKYIDRILEEENIQQHESKEQKTLIRGKNEWVVTFNSYKIEKNENYYNMKTRNIENWSDISFIIFSVEKYLKKIKIMHLSFKLEIETFLSHFWVCKKIDEKQLATMLKINLKIREKDKNHEEIKIKRLFSSKEEVIKELTRIWKDRKNLKLMKRVEKSKAQMINWIGLRMIVRFRMKKQKGKALAIAKDLNRRLKVGDWDHDVEIYIPSFSEHVDIREETQYMEYYENIFYHIWSSSQKQIVLILPAVNQNILSFLQERTKISNNVTIICPETHQLYPKTLPLAACLLYSSVAINKLKNILDGKKGVIIPGRNVSESSIYEISLSHMLVCPLYCPLNKQNSLMANKRILNKCLSTIPYREINPNSQFNAIIESLADLISKNPKTNNWMFKIDGEFNGRGFAFFNVSSSKKLVKIMQIGQIESNQHRMNERMKNYLMEEAKVLVIEYLKTYFRLKLKVNFENTIFRTEEYIDCFLQKGGVIQQMIEDCDTYEFCFQASKEYETNTKVNCLNICQIFPIDFVMRSSLYGGQIPEKLMIVKKQLENMLEKEEYIGYISVVLLWEANKEKAYGVEIKFHLTPMCSIGFFINNINNSHRGRSNTNALLSFTELSTQRDQRNSMSFLFIPAIIFTDVEQMAKCELIQALIIESWQNLSTQLFSSSVFLNDSDSLCGSFYLSMGLTLGLLLYSRSYEVKKLKKMAIESIRVLSQKISGLKKVTNYHQRRRDVFQISDIIRSITSIKI